MIETDFRFCRNELENNLVQFCVKHVACEVLELSMAECFENSSFKQAIEKGLKYRVNELYQMMNSMLTQT